MNYSSELTEYLFRFYFFCLFLRRPVPRQSNDYFVKAAGGTGTFVSKFTAPTATAAATAAAMTEMTALASAAVAASAAAAAASAAAAAAAPAQPAASPAPAVVSATVAVSASAVVSVTASASASAPADAAVVMAPTEKNLPVSSTAALLALGTLGELQPLIDSFSQHQFAQVPFGVG